MNGITNDAAAKLAPAGAWDDNRRLEFAALSSEEFVPGRVFAANREIFRIRTAEGEVDAAVSGRLRQKLEESSFPVTGDWTAVDIQAGRAVIQDLLPRRSFFSRQAAGKDTEEQVVAANIDFAFIMQGLDRDFSLNRLDRYLVQVRHGMLQPVVILTKADLCTDVPGYLARTGYELGNINVHAISVKEDYGLSELESYLQPGFTCILIGSSGVGKSTLLNRLLSVEVAATGPVSPGNGRGRHITTGSRLYETHSGAYIIDCPGIREVQLWADDASCNRAFADIASLATKCKFRDCAHHGEPGCAVQQALLQGRITEERFLNYMKLKQELGETKATILRKKEQRFKKIAILSRQHRRMFFE